MALEPRYEASIARMFSIKMSFEEAVGVQLAEENTERVKEDKDHEALANFR